MKKFKLAYVIGFLILLDQSIKLYIKHNMLDKNFNIFGELVQFKPKFNDKYSWINSLFNLGINRTIHIMIAIISIVLMYIVFKFIKTMYIKSQILEVIFSVIISGAICSLIDKLFWGGSLDYILLKGLFTFDLKDVYLTMFEIAGIGMLFTNYKGLRGLSNKKLIYDFKQFVKQEIRAYKNHN